MESDHSPSSSGTSTVSLNVHVGVDEIHNHIYASQSDSEDSGSSSSLDSEEPLLEAEEEKEVVIVESTMKDNHILLEAATEEEEEVPKKPGRIFNNNNPSSFARFNGGTADWDDFLNFKKHKEHLKYIPHLSYFPKAPLSDALDEILNALEKYVEMPNVFLPYFEKKNAKEVPAYWFAKVVGFSGYKCCMEMVRLGLEKEKRTFFHSSFFSKVPKPLGWSFKNQKLLVPELDVQEKVPNWSSKIKDALANKSTIAEDHLDFFKEKIRNCQKMKFQNGSFLSLKLNDQVEIFDKLNINVYRIGYIDCIVGDRIHIQYDQKKKHFQDDGFWINIKSDYLHPMGWSLSVGHTHLHENFIFENLEMYRIDPNIHPEEVDGLELESGLYFEVVHPVMAQMIAPARVFKILNYGYFMAVIEPHNSPRTIFCLHVRSPLIKMCGWAEAHGIDINCPAILEGMPKGSQSLYNDFNWEKFFDVTGMEPLTNLPEPESKGHQFKPGMKLEAVDTSRPAFIGSWTILRVCDNLLFIHVDGYDFKLASCQWVDAYSPDIYPIGACELIGYNFQSCPTHPISDIFKGAHAAGLIPSPICPY